VREAGRERADRIHALRVDELIAQAFAIGLGALPFVELVRELSRGRFDVEPMGLGADQRAAQADLHDHRDRPDPDERERIDRQAAGLEREWHAERHHRHGRSDRVHRVDLQRRGRDADHERQDERSPDRSRCTTTAC